MLKAVFKVFEESDQKSYTEHYKNDGSQENKKAGFVVIGHNLTE